MTRRVLHLRSSGGLLGAEQVVLGLCSHSLPFGYDCRLAVIHDAGDPIPALHTVASLRGVASDLLEFRRRVDLRALRRLRALIHDREIDIVHCHGYREDFCAVASMLPARLVATNHLWKRSTRALRFYARLDSWIIRRFDRVVAVSGAIQQELARAGLRKPQLTYVPNGVDVERFSRLSDVRSPVRDELTLGGEGPVIAAISSLTVEKGHAFLLHSVAALAAELPGLRLAIVGEGPLRASLGALAESLDIGARVAFLGRREDVPEILRATDIYALPSLSEGFPIALLEAMAAGKACVATDVGDVGRAVESQVTGLLVPPGDIGALAAAIAKLARDPGLRRELGANAQRAVAERHTLAAMARDYCRIYDELF